jgi:hypothetical protein
VGQQDLKLAVTLNRTYNLQMSERSTLLQPCKAVCWASAGWREAVWASS